MSRKTSLILLLILSLLVLGCSSKKNRNMKKAVPKVENIKIGAIVGNTTSPQPFIIMEKDLLEEKLGPETKVQLEYSRDANVALNNLKEERFDFFYLWWGAFVEYTSKLSKYGEGNNYIVIANSTSMGSGAALMGQSGITDIKQLKGKTIGVFNSDSSTETLVANTLKEYGLDSTTRGGDVKIIKSNSQQVLNDFVQNKIDALMARSDYINGLKQMGKTVILNGDKLAYHGKAPAMMLCVRRELLEKNPRLIESVLEAHLEATDYFKNHKEEFVENFYPIKEQFFIDQNIKNLSRTKQVTMQTFKNLPIEPYPNLKWIDDVWTYMDKYNSQKPYSKNELVNFSLFDKVLNNKNMLSVDDYNKQNFNL